MGNSAFISRCCFDDTDEEHLRRCDLVNFTFFSSARTTDHLTLHMHQSIGYVEKTLV